MEAFGVDCFGKPQFVSPRFEWTIPALFQLACDQQALRSAPSGSPSPVRPASEPDVLPFALPISRSVADANHPLTNGYREDGGPSARLPDYLLR